MNTPARELYEERHQDISLVMAWLEIELGKHQLKAKGDPSDWGYTGELGHVRQQLIETLAYIAGKEPDIIEDLLCFCR